MFFLQENAKPTMNINIINVPTVVARMLKVQSKENTCEEISERNFSFLMDWWCQKQRIEVKQQNLHTHRLRTHAKIYFYCDSIKAKRIGPKGLIPSPVLTFHHQFSLNGWWAWVLCGKRRRRGRKVGIDFCLSRSEAYRLKALTDAR